MFTAFAGTAGSRSEMAEPPAKPDGSNIEEIDDLDGRTYRLKWAMGGPSRFVIAAFLVFWLCGWAVGFVSAADTVLNGPEGPTVFVILAQGFLVFWLVGWTCGGIFAVFMLYIVLRPRRPEIISLKHDSFQYDSGTAQIRRKQVEIRKRDVGNVVLERVEERQRLYVDHGADRIEIGEHLPEPDRE
jgi:hypothetical protein